MNDEIATNRKRCKWCDSGKYNPLSIERRYLYVCKHPEQDFRQRILFWPTTGCPGFVRAAGSDDDYHPITRKGFNQ